MEALSTPSESLEYSCAEILETSTLVYGDFLGFFLVFCCFVFCTKMGIFFESLLLMRQGYWWGVRLETVRQQLLNRGHCLCIPCCLVGCETVGYPRLREDFPFAPCTHPLSATRWGCKPEFRPWINTFLSPQESISMILARSGTSLFCYYFQLENAQDILIHK